MLAKISPHAPKKPRGNFFSPSLKTKPTPTDLFFTLSKTRCPLVVQNASSQPIHSLSRKHRSFSYITPPLNPHTTTNNPIPNPQKSSKNPTMASKNQSNFQDFLPLMAEKLGGDGLIAEMCNGFHLLIDSSKGVITFESLKRNSALLGLQDLSDDDLHSMLKEGDFDGDGALNQMEFCVLMFRLSPELMEQSEFFLEEALQQGGFQDIHLY